MPLQSRSDRRVAYPVGTKVRVRRHDEYLGQAGDIFATPMARFENMITTILETFSIEEGYTNPQYYLDCSGIDWYYTNTMIEVIGDRKKPCATSEAFTDMFN